MLEIGSGSGQHAVYCVAGGLPHLRWQCFGPRGAAARHAPIELPPRQGDSFTTRRIDYHAGVRHPHLERIPCTPDRLSQALVARTAK